MHCWIIDNSTQVKDTTKLMHILLFVNFGPPPPMGLCKSNTQLWGRLHQCNCKDYSTRGKVMKAWCWCDYKEVLLFCSHWKWCELVCGLCGRGPLCILAKLWKPCGFCGWLPVATLVLVDNLSLRHSCCGCGLDGSSLLAQLPVYWSGFSSYGATSHPLT